MIFARFLTRWLVRAGGLNSTHDLDECVDLLVQVREAWAAITRQTVGEVNRRMFVVYS